MNKNCLGGPVPILLGGAPEGPRWTFAWQDQAHSGLYGAPLNPVRRMWTVLAIISMYPDAHEACMSSKIVHMSLSNVCTYNQFKMLLWMRDWISHKCHRHHAWCSFHEGTYILFYFIGTYLMTRSALVRLTCPAANMSLKACRGRSISLSYTS